MQFSPFQATTLFLKGAQSEEAYLGSFGFRLLSLSKAAP